MKIYNLGWVGLVSVIPRRQWQCPQTTRVKFGERVWCWNLFNQETGRSLEYCWLGPPPSTHQCICLSRMEKKNNIYYFSDLTEPLALMYYPEERRIKSYTLWWKWHFISHIQLGIPIFSLDFTLFYKKDTWDYVEDEKRHGLQNKIIKINIEGLKTVLWITWEMM